MLFLSLSLRLLLVPTTIKPFCERGNRTRGQNKLLESELKGIEGIGLLKKRSLEKISKVSSKFCFAKAIYDATLENRSLEIKVT